MIESKNTSNGQFRQFLEPGLWVSFQLRSFSLSGRTEEAGDRDGATVKITGSGTVDRRRRRSGGAGCLQLLVALGSPSARMRDSMEPEDASKEIAEECDDAHLHHSIHNLPKNFDFKMSEYRNTAYAGVLSQGSSNSYRHPGRNVANESEGTNMEGLQG
ncbi:hypothetical protein NL676_035558 [Syzygium grande]|nr:hypothetical protein NL676_035558 [Syzygium grande]